MARPRNLDRQRWEWPGIPGYVAEFTQGDYQEPVAYHFYKKHRKSTGLPASKEFERTYRKLHIAWVEEVILRERGLILEPKVEKSEEGRPTSIARLWREFLVSNKHRLPKTAQQKLKQAVGAHFPHDIPLSERRVYEQLSSSLADSEFSANTLRKHLTELRRMFRFAVDSGWLEKNPVDRVGIPRAAKKKDVNVWTREEIQQICTDLREQRQTHSEWHALFIEWQSLTSMRPSETLRMRLDHIERDRLRVPISKTDTKYIPIMNVKKLAKEYPKRADWQTRIQAILNELQDHYRKRRPEMIEDPRISWAEGHLWPFNNTIKLGTAFNLARKDLRLRSGRIYDLRASAEDYWVWELGFGLETICELAGHSPAIYIHHYRKRYGTEAHQRISSGR